MVVYSLDLHHHHHHWFSIMTLVDCRWWSVRFFLRFFLYYTYAWVKFTVVFAFLNTHTHTLMLDSLFFVFFWTFFCFLAFVYLFVSRSFLTSAPSVYSSLSFWWWWFFLVFILCVCVCDLYQWLYRDLYLFFFNIPLSFFFLL